MYDQLQHYIYKYICFISGKNAARLAKKSDVNGHVFDYKQTVKRRLKMYSIKIYFF